MPEATEEQDRQLTGFRLIRALQNLPAAVLERPVRVYVEPLTESGDNPRWIPVVGVTNTADAVEIALEDEE